MKKHGLEKREQRDEDAKGERETAPSMMGESDMEENGDMMGESARDDIEEDN